MNHYSSEGAILVVLAAVFGSLFAVNATHSAPKPPQARVETSYRRAEIEAVAALSEQADTERLMAAIRHVESHGDPRAVSKKGARGAYQTMAATERNPGLGVRPMLHYTQKEQERFARDYAVALRERYARMLAEGAYNAGVGAVDRALKETLARLPMETRHYVKKVELAMNQN